MPRKYDMSKRSAAVEETRKRIVEATMELHNSKGPAATSWEEIAERADVSPATVYRHFPSFDELLPACGELSFRRLDLPGDDRVRERFDRVEGARQRLALFVTELFAIYERGGRAIWAVRRDREALPVLQEAHEEIEGRLEAIAEIALGPLGLDQRQLRVVRAETDYDTWSSLLAHGIERESAADVVVGMLACWLGLDDGEDRAG